MPPSICKMGGQMERDSHVFYHPPVVDHYYEKYPSYRRGTPPSFHPKMVSPHARKYATSASTHNYRVGRAGSFARQPHVGSTSLGIRETSSRRKKCPSTYKSRRSSVGESRTIPHNSFAYPSPLSSDSISGSSESGCKYNTNPRQWYVEAELDKRSLKSELSKKMGKINELCSRIQVLENDQERRKRQLSSTKKQVLSKHHKLTNAKKDVEELKCHVEELTKKVSMLEEQLTVVTSSTTEKERKFADQSKKLQESQKNVEKLTKQLGVSKQLLVQKDEYFRKNVQQFQHWNYQLSQKNYQFSQKSMMLEKSYETSRHDIETLKRQNRSLKRERDMLLGRLFKLMDTEKEQKSKIKRLKKRLSGWAVSESKWFNKAQPELEQNGKEGEKPEEDSYALPKIVPDDCVPGFILDESNLSKEERTIKPQESKSSLTECQQSECTYRAIPNLPSRSVLHQIFELGGKLFDSDLLEGTDEFPSKSHPVASDQPAETLKKDTPDSTNQPASEMVEPWQLPDPEVVTKCVKVRAFEKLHITEGDTDEGN